MSKVPTSKEIPPTPQQVDHILQSVMAHTQQLIADDPRHFVNLQASFLAFYTHPTFQLILGIPSQIPHTTPSPPNNQLQAKLQSMRSSIQALTKSVADLQPRVKRGESQPSQPTPPIGNPLVQGKRPTPPCAQTYAFKAASTSQPSLVLDLGATNPNDQFDSTINDTLNGYMHEIGHNKIKFSTTRYNKKGNCYERTVLYCAALIPKV